MSKKQLLQTILLLVSVHGLPQENRMPYKNIEEANAEYTECIEKIAPKYKFVYKSPDGLRRDNIWKRHNKKVDKELNKLNGKDWERRFKTEITNCYLDKIVFQKSRRKYMGFDKLNYEIDDRIITPRVEFDFEGGSNVRHESLDSLRVIAEFIIKHPDLLVEIGCHTDLRGNDEYNLDLSKYRCEKLEKTLRHKLSLNGYDNFTVRGYGEEEPIVSIKAIELFDNKMLEEEIYRINRRIELKVVDKIEEE